MKLIRTKPRKMSWETLVASEEFLLLLFVIVVAALSFFFLMRSADRTRESIPHGVLQERIGYMITTLARYDHDRLAKLRQQWVTLVQQAMQLGSTREAKLQEALGLAITRKSQMILSEQAWFRKAVLTARGELRQFNAEKSSRWQEKLGMAVLVAYRRSPEMGDAFQAAFLREVNRLKKVEERKARRLESHLATITAQEVLFRNAIPLIYQETIESTRRSVRMSEESQSTQIRRAIHELAGGLTWQRLPEDYMQIVGLAKETLTGHRAVGGFMEYGLQALVGLMLGVLWVASITRKDFPV